MDDDDLLQGHFNIMDQLQTALFGTAGVDVNQEDMERIRRNLVQQQGLFSGSSRASATHSSQISSIIRSIPQQSADPVLLYTIFTELWELIVLTGEEVEAHEFDNVVDLRPLLPHLLRVLQWDVDCQSYGMEFLLYTVRCTRACIQYSPNCAHRLVDSGVVPLITRQLFSVEYIDLAEDLIQVIQLLTRSAYFPRACLHADGIRAVLGFIDFFSLSVQINALTAAAQMAVALTNETIHLYLPDDISAMLRGMVRQMDAMETDQQVLKLSHWALKTLYNSLLAAPKHADSLFPADFVLEKLITLGTLLPVDSALIVNKLVAVSDASRKALLLNSNSNCTLVFLKTLLSKSTKNEPLLENTLKIVVELFCQLAQKPLKDLLPICIKNYTSTRIDCTPVDSATLDSLCAMIHEFYLNSPSISQSQRHLVLLALLLLDDVNGLKSVSLFKMSTISRLIGELKDPLSLIIGLEWCRSLVKNGSNEFIITANRQGLLSELEALHNASAISCSVLELIKKWLKDRLESMNITVFSGEEEESLRIYIKHVSGELVNLLQPSIGETQPADYSYSPSFDNLENFLTTVEKEQFTEFEWLGDPKTCLARVLLNLIKQQSASFVEPVRFESICQIVYKALNRYDTQFTAVLPSSQLTRSTRTSLESLALIARPMRVIIHTSAYEKMLVCDPFSNISWLVMMAVASDEDRKILLRDTRTSSNSGSGTTVRERIYDALGGSKNKQTKCIVYSN